MTSVGWVYENGDKGWLVEVEVLATVVPYVPARTNCRNDDASPSEGGYLEDEAFQVTGFKLEVGNHVYEVPLSAGLSEALSQEVRRAYEGDADLQSEVYGLFE